MRTGWRNRKTKNESMSKSSRHAHTQPYLRASELEELKGAYGSKQSRISRDQQRPWKACCLTLTELNNSDKVVCTPEGHLFAREALLENLMAQKLAYKAQLKAWEQQERQDRAESRETEDKAAQAAEAKFVRQHEGLADEPKQSEDSVGGIKRGRGGGSDYWRDVARPVRARVDRPKKGTVSPETGTAISLKDLQTVKLGSACATCAQVLSDKSRLVVLVPTGTLMCAHCAALDPVVRDPHSNEPCSVIFLRRGGTGFAANDDQTSQVVTRRIGFQLG